jgi:hypothetical protein
MRDLMVACGLITGRGDLARTPSVGDIGAERKRGGAVSSAAAQADE